MIKRGKDCKLPGTREKRPGDTRFQADDTWRACASRCHGLEGVLRRRLRSACSRARACTSLTCTSLTSHRARARRPRRLVSGNMALLGVFSSLWQLALKGPPWLVLLYYVSASPSTWGEKGYNGGSTPCMDSQTHVHRVVDAIQPSYPLILQEEKGMRDI